MAVKTSGSDNFILMGCTSMFHIENYTNFKQDFMKGVFYLLKA